MDRRRAMAAPRDSRHHAVVFRSHLRRRASGRGRIRVPGWMGGLALLLLLAPGALQVASAQDELYVANFIGGDVTV